MIKMYTPVYPSITILKWGLRGVFFFLLLKWGSSGYTFNRHNILVEKS